MHYVLYEPNHQIIIVEEFTLTKQGVTYNHKHKPNVDKAKPSLQQHILFYIKHYHNELSDGITIFQLGFNKLDSI